MCLKVCLKLLKVWGECVWHILICVWHTHTYTIGVCIVCYTLFKHTIPQKMLSVFKSVQIDCTHSTLLQCTLCLNTCIYMYVLTHFKHNFKHTHTHNDYTIHAYVYHMCLHGVYTLYTCVYTHIYSTHVYMCMIVWGVCVYVFIVVCRYCVYVCLNTVSVCLNTHVYFESHFVYVF